MKNSNLILVILLNLTILTANCQNMEQPKYRYFDGSGNIYIITENCLEYIPVKKENSSSGIYSGGKMAEVEISKENFEEIQVLIEDIFNTNAIRITERIMTSGELEKTFNGQTERIIFQQSPQKDKLEIKLKELLK